EAAMEQLFNVAAGLDSQILGDYEIVGQIKQSARFSKEQQSLGVYLERLMNEVLQCSKSIRTNTALSGGTVSVSFAAVQYIKKHFTSLEGKKILLIGTGKIGSNTCRNIVDYLPGVEVTLINRSIEKAKALAEEHGLHYTDMGALQQEVDKADIIIVSTNADTPVLLKDHFTKQADKLLIDLSVPCNVDAAVRSLPGITLQNVDELSKIKDETLQKRKGEIPKAKAIIREHILAFREWHEMRRNVPVLKAVKDKLETIYSLPFTEWCTTIKAGEINGDKIQKVISGMAVKMKTHNQRGCHYIQAINDFITPSSN
ncbi:MAG: glutamyl-tRNA reductase, partial [Pedobacter sp.]